MPSQRSFPRWHVGVAPTPARRHTVGRACRRWPPGPRPRGLAPVRGQCPASSSGAGTCEAGRPGWRVSPDQRRAEPQEQPTPPPMSKPSPGAGGAVILGGRKRAHHGLTALRRPFGEAKALRVPRPVYCMPWAVRTPISRSRTRWRAWLSGWSSCLRGTKRLGGRVPAAALAAAARLPFCSP